MHSSLFRNLAAVCVLTAATHVPAQSPQPHILRGTVHAHKDASSISGATIRLIPSGAPAITAAVNPDGNFVIALPDGAHAPLEIVIAAPGFQETHLHLDRLPDGTGMLDAALDVDGVATTVTVNGESAPLEQELPTISQLISGKTLDQLPENGRNLSKLSLLNPQVRSTSGIGSDAINGARLNVNGDIFRYTRYTVDGLTGYEATYGNAPLMALPISAIAEMKVLTNQYDVLFGGTTTGVIAYTTRAGGEQMHGEAAFFGRPSGLQAAPPVATVRMPNSLLDGYGRLGGPLFTPHTRFFATYEQDSFHRGSFIQGPVPQVYMGNGSEFYTLARVDRDLSTQHLLSVRVNGDRTYTSNPNDRVGGLVQASAGQTNRTQAMAAAVSLTSTVGSKVNVAQFQFVHALPYVLTPNQPSISVVRAGISTEGGSTALHLRNMTEDFRDTLQWVHGAHSLSVGFEGTRSQVHYVSTTPFGTYTATTGGYNYTQTFGVADTNFKDSYVVGFAQDTWRAVTGLTLTLGARYEYQGLTGDTNNIAPRIGLAYDAFGNGRTILRGGFGYFFGEDYLQLLQNSYAGGVVSPTATYTYTPGQAGAPTFPNNLAAPPATGQGNRDLFLLPQRLLNPYNMQTTLSVEQQLGKGWLLSVNGIHSTARKQLSSTNLNAPYFVRTQPGQVAPSSNRPLKTYAGVAVNNVIQVANGNSTEFNALRIDLIRHAGKWFDWNTAYIYSSALTYSVFQGEGTTGIPNDWYQPKLGEYGPTDFSQRHRSVNYGTLRLPWASHLTGVLTAATGLPVNPITGVDNNKDGYTTDRPIGFSRDSFRGPRQVSIDLSAGKLVKFGDRFSTDLRIDAFNLFNHSNFVTLNNVYGNAAAPAKTFLAHLAGLGNADPGRQLQFGARLMF